jgi:hypothetical protein
MPSGRPRSSIPEDEELIKLGEDLLLWASEKKKGELRCRWCEWYCRKHFFIRKQWKRMVDTEVFRPYYEAAQAFLADKWIDGTINASIAQRYLRIYDPELRESEDVDADEKEVRKAAALKNETRAVEEERNRVLEEIQRTKREPL